MEEELENHRKTTRKSKNYNLQLDCVHGCNELVGLHEYVSEVITVVSTVLNFFKSSLTSF